MKYYLLFLAWFASLLGSFGSLYLEYFHFMAPCTLCWYERVCLFTLPLLLGVACFKKACTIISYILPQVVIGLLLSSYQLILADLDTLKAISVPCLKGVCNQAISITKNVQLPISLFAMALFFLLLALLLLSYSLDKNNLSIK